jgi:predicted regulator of Ras-like GTPase activity (Roadblock/LC7/MglB family)
MFNTLRRFFGRRGSATLDAPGEFDSSAQTADVQSGTPKSVRVDAQPAPVARPGNTPANVGVPLKSIIVRLPPDLMQRVCVLDVGETEIFVPIQKILSQISSGAVRISFGELRQLAPPGIFTAENDRDRTPIDLPLQEILAHLNPGLLMRRPTQRHVEVPPEVVGPFGGQTKVVISTAGAKAAAPVAAPAPPPTRQRPPTGPGVPPPLRAQPPQPAPVQAAPRVQPETVTAFPPPRQQPPAAPPQPIFARIRPSAPQVPPRLPAQPVAVAPPPAPEFVEEAPFTEANRFAPEPTALPPIFTPIAPEPEPAHSSDTKVIQMPETYSPLPQTTNELPPVAASFAPPITPIAPEPEPEPEPIRFSAPAPTPAPTPAPAVPVSSGETRFITVAIAELYGSWPEALRNEINGQKLSNSWIGLPLGAVEGVIKSGKVAFPWKALRSWIKPYTAVAPSPYDTTMLELPLKVITPLFLSELKATRAQKRYSLDDDIPDLFFNSQPAVETPVAVSAPPLPPTPPPAIVPPPVAPTPALPIQAPPAIPAFPAKAESARPADTNYFVWKGNAQGSTAGNTPEAEPAEEPPVFIKKGSTTPGTAFLNRYATPNEIVSKAAALEGVDGALIALPDGLLVASRIPTNMNADTIAAFLPQIFGRVSQCTRELRLGELNNLNFTVGNIPWKIFRVGSIYFAAFGRPGVPLPTAQLVGLAAELDRKAK